MKKGNEEMKSHFQNEKGTGPSVFCVQKLWETTSKISLKKQLLYNIDFYIVSVLSDKVFFFGMLAY